MDSDMFGSGGGIDAFVQVDFGNSLPVRTKARTASVAEVRRPGALTGSGPPWVGLDQGVRVDWHAELWVPVLRPSAENENQMMADQVGWSQCSHSMGASLMMADQISISLWDEELLSSASLVAKSPRLSLSELGACAEAFDGKARNWEGVSVRPQA